MEDILAYVREKIACPQFGDNHYGEWGALPLRQRAIVKRLIDYSVGQEEVINRQKAEIENLNKDLADTIALNHEERKGFKAEIERLRAKDETRHKVYMTKCEELETAKSEAIKEFAERLKNSILPQLSCSTLEKKEAYYFCLDNIDILVQEMVGEPIGDIRNNGEDIRHEESQDEYPHGEQSAQPWKTAMLNTFLGGKRDE